MSAALYALAGTVIGVLGTVLADLVRASREHRNLARNALRVVCSDFTAQIARVRRYSIQLRREPQGPLYQETWQQLQATFTEARAYYERLLITADSVAIQEAARHVVHYAYYMSRAAHMEMTGFAEAQAEMFSWSTRLYIEVRRELGVKHPRNVYEDPSGGLPIPGHRIEGSST
jgi:hypothetical protein